MPPTSARFSESVLRWFTPGGLYTFVGAGGKSTAMKSVAAVLVRFGLRVRMTTTTRVAIDEFAGFQVRVAADRDRLHEIAAEETPLLLAVAGETDDHQKYRGIESGLLVEMPVPEDMVVLVEGDGSRGLPMKVPREREPVIPRTSSAVFAFMGARAFDGPIDRQTCYNHEKAVSLLTPGTAWPGEPRFTAEAIAELAGHPQAGRKGVLPGMSFRVVVNQGDLSERRPTAERSLQIMKDVSGLDGVLLSCRKGEIYVTTD